MLRGFTLNDFHGAMLNEVHVAHDWLSILLGTDMDAGYF